MAIKWGRYLETCARDELVAPNMLSSAGPQQQAVLATAGAMEDNAMYMPVSCPLLAEESGEEDCCGMMFGVFGISLQSSRLFGCYLRWQSLVLR